MFSKDIIILVFFSSSFFVSCSDGSQSISSQDSATTSKNNNIVPNSRWPNLKGKIKIDSFYKVENIFNNEDKAGKLQKILMDSLPKVQIGGDFYWIIEQDLKLDKDDLYQYCQAKLSLLDSAVFEKAISDQNFAALSIGVAELGKEFERWPEGYEISYAVLKNSFSSVDNYKILSRRLKKAAEEWMGICNVSTLR